MLFDLFEPAAKIFKGFVASDIVGQEDAMGTAIENSSHRFERLLTSLGRKIKQLVSKHRNCSAIKDTYGVPNLQLDDLIVDLKAVRAEFHSNSHLMLLLEFIVHDALH